MSDSIPIPAYADLTQYNHIRSVRPTDGAEIRAQRIMVDEHTPIRWTIVVMDKMGNYLFIENTENKVRKQYSTSELVDLAKNAGFGEWQQAQVGEAVGIALVKGEQREIVMRQYQVPDTTPYPID